MMGKQKDLLPWIFSGLLLACVAAAVAVGSYKLAPNAARAPVRTTAQPSPTPAVPVPPPATPAAPTPLTAAATPSPAVPVETSVDPMPSGGHVWECTTNGQKTFSDNPCGAKSTLREISPINI